jgi:hypothetical protein
MLSPVYGVPVARNVGTGPALGCDLHLHFAERDHTVDHRRWLAQVMAPGEEHQFLPPEGVSNITGLVGRFPIIRLEGQVSDVFGEEHTVDERIDLVEWWSNLEHAGRRFEEEPVARLVHELKEIKKELAAIRARCRNRQGKGGEPNAARHKILPRLGSVRNEEPGGLPSES